MPGNPSAQSARTRRAAGVLIPSSTATARWPASCSDRATAGGSAGAQARPADPPSCALAAHDAALSRRPSATGGNSEGVHIPEPGSWDRPGSGPAAAGSLLEAAPVGSRSATPTQRAAGRQGPGHPPALRQGCDAQRSGHRRPGHHHRRGHSAGLPELPEMPGGRAAGLDGADSAGAPGGGLPCRRLAAGLRALGRPPPAKQPPATASPPLRVGLPWYRCCHLTVCSQGIGNWKPPPSCLFCHCCYCNASCCGHCTGCAREPDSP
jgi:hypothetical protein